MPKKSIIEGIRKFRSEIFPEHQELFDHLKSGQKPEVLLITCSDSRVDPALITQTLPGELFVIRNAGNLIGTYGPQGTAEEGTIEYAVKVLGVKHIVVCGHSECGAMGAVLAPESLSELPAVAAWLAKAGPEKAPGEDITLADQVRFNVNKQIENLLTHPAVKDAERKGALSLHGWVYDFGSGEVSEMDPGSGSFSPLVSS